MRSPMGAMVVSLLLAVGSAGSALADSLADGMAAAQTGDYATALKLWLPLAEGGDPNAQSYLGRLYLNGWGVAKDYGQAARWYGKAAEQGNEAAENNLGFMYAHGQGVTQDFGQSVKWYLKAADQGALEAYMNLGDAYAGGRGVPKDYAEAAKWYRRAADNGFPGAKQALDALDDKRGPPLGSRNGNAP